MGEGGVGGRGGGVERQGEQNERLIWCFKSSQPQKNKQTKKQHQGWKQTSIYLQVIYSTSHYTTRLFFTKLNSDSIISFRTQTQKTIHMFWIMSIFRGNSARDPASSRVTISFCQPTQEPALATANTGKIGNVLEKNEGEWTERVKIGKEQIPGRRRKLHGQQLLQRRSPLSIVR